MILGLAAGAAAAGPGALDTSFGNGGKTTFHIRGADSATAVAVQPDGKNVLVGQAAPSASAPGNCAAARLNRNGTLDSSFGAGGTAQVSFGGDDACFSGVLQPDGKLVVAGKTTVSGVDQWALARLNANGSPDSSFGNGGTAIITWGNNGGRAVAVLVQPDGRILVAGSTSTAATQTDFTLVRLTANGAIDTSFGAGGHTVVDFGGDDRVEDAALQPDGRIILAGSTTAGGGGHNFAAARLNGDGSLDTSFGSAGKSTVDFGGDDGASAVLLQSGGKVVLAGDTSAGAGGSDMAVTRLNPDGSLDASFGTGGKQTVDFGGFEPGLAAALQANGAILVVGGTTQGSGEAFAIARLTAAGALDSTFGLGGKTTVDFGGVSVGRGVAVQADGNIVVDGVSGAGEFAVARLTGDGGGAGALPPPTRCHGSVLALGRGGWRCVRVAGVDDRLLPRAGDLPGYRSVGGGAGAARTALGGGPLRGAGAQGAAFRAGKRSLSFGVFMFSTSHGAATGLSSVVNGRSHMRLAGGVRGLLRARSTRRSTDVAIAFQVGRAVGAVRLRVTARLGAARGITAAYARQLAVRLRRVLSLSAWERTLDGIEPDGTFTPKLALQVFAIAYGAVPGVRAPGGGSSPGVDGTAATQMVARVWNRLTGAQHRAIERALHAPHDASSPRLAHDAADPAPVPSPKYQAIADKYNAIYRAKLPTAPPVNIKAFTTSVQPSGRDLMNALPVNARGEFGNGPVAYCRVLVTPRGAARPDVDRQMAHELFHCYMFALDPNWPSLSTWIVEGMAEWAAAFVTGSDSIGWLQRYMKTPTSPLFARTYDSVGFWGHADEAGGRDSLWAKIPGILNAGSNEASYARAGGTSPGFVDTWASAAFRFSGSGEAWDQTDPVHLPINSPTVAFDPITSSSNLASSPYALHEYNVTGNPDTPVVEVDGFAGTVRASSGKADFGPIIKDFFCVSGKCECPPGQEGSPPVNHPVQTLWLAVTGGASIGEGQVIYHSMDEYCQAKKPGGGGGGPGVGKGPPGLQVRALDDSLSLLGTINRGSCSFTGGSFIATGSGGGFRFKMVIAHANSPGHYTIPNNSGSTYVHVSRGGTTFSTQGRNTTVLGVTGPRDAGLALIKTRRVRVGKRTVIRYRISVGIDDLVTGGHPGVLLIPGPGGLAC